MSPNTGWFVNNKAIILSKYPLENKRRLFMLTEEWVRNNDETALRDQCSDFNSISAKLEPMPKQKVFESCSGIV